MDHQSSSLILSSNAPPNFHDDEVSGYFPYRALQEACGNNGIENDRNVQCIKADYTRSSENGLVDLQRGSNQISDDDNRGESSRLWRHLVQCEPYTKYRLRQPKGEEIVNPERATWPDHIEFAFWQGLYTSKGFGDD